MRLSYKTLNNLKDDVLVSAYDPAAHKSGIVHFGIGQFHRAHQAWYTDKLLAQYGGDWRITAVSLRSATVRDTMKDQDYLYTVAVRDKDQTHYSVLAAISDVLVAPEDPSAVVGALASPDTHVVTLTITEKGYAITPKTGRLNLSDPDIAHDLQAIDSPKTAIGFLVAGLQKRREKGLNGLTIISCDNLTANGEKLKQAVYDFAGQIDSALCDWTKSNVCFPSTMVDRIVPAITPIAKEEIAAATGLRDEACAVTEPFIQWVIEDNFAGPMPRWDLVGATYTDVVEPYENMKLRMLNASHSCLAYLGALAGYVTIAAAVSDPDFQAMTRRLMLDEMVPTLTIPAGFSTQDYAEQLIDRFANTGVPYTTQQVAMDGSQKIPQRFLPALESLTEKGQDADIICLCIAAWIRYTRGQDDLGNHYDIADPLAAHYSSLQHLQGREYCSAMLSIEDIFPSSLMQASNVTNRIQFWSTALDKLGAKGTVKRHFSGQPNHKD